MSDREPSKEALEAAKRYLDSIEGYHSPDVHCAIALDAFAQPWRDRLAEQCGKTLAAQHVAQQARDAALEDAARWMAPNFPGQARDMLRALKSKPAAGDQG